jgi:SulP family sulfate permease
MTATLKNLSAGVFSAFVMISFAVGYGALVFHDPLLQPYTAVGVHAALVATIVLLFVNSLLSSFRFSLAGPDSNSAILLAALASSIAAALQSRNAPVGSMLATVLMSFTLAGFFVGAVALLLGSLKQGKKVGLVPYPVLAGFLSGTGVLIVFGGLRLILPADGTSLAMLGQNREFLLSCGVVAVVVIGITVLPKLWKNFLAFPLVIVFGTFCFYAGARLFGFTPTMFISLQKPDLLPEGTLPLPVNAAVDWGVLLDHLPFLIPLTVVIILTSLVNSAGLDLDEKEDGDFNRELFSIGFALIVSGACGGLLGHTSASRSFLHRRAGGDSRVGGVFAALVCLGITIWAPWAITCIPRPVLAGMLISSGLAMIREWVVKSVTRLPPQEYFLILIIMVLVFTKGSLVGVLVGITITALLFVYNYSLITCVRNRFACGEFLSNRDRPVQHISRLREHGQRSRIFCLQGYVFFGTANSILAEVKELIHRERCEFVLLDFRNVQGLDASASFGFCKLEQVCLRAGTILSFSGLPAHFQVVFTQAGLNKTDTIRFEKDLDMGLEWIEDKLLTSACRDATPATPANSANPGNSIAPPTLVTSVSIGAESPVFYGKSAFHLAVDPAGVGNAAAELEEIGIRQIFAPFLTRSETLEIILKSCETLDLAEGEILFHKGDASDGVYFIEKGLLAVDIPLENGERKRIRTLGPGTVVGEMSFFTSNPRSAEVQARKTSRVVRISLDHWQKLSHDHPLAAQDFQVFIIKLLSFRLAASTAQIVALS